MSKTRKNHLIPKFIIKNFNTGEGIFVLTGEKIEQKNKKNIFSANRIFDQKIEDILSRTESKSANIVNKKIENFKKLVNNHVKGPILFIREFNYSIVLPSFPEHKILNTFISNSFFKYEFLNNIEKKFPEKILLSKINNLNTIVFIHYAKSELIGDVPFVLSDMGIEITFIDDKQIIFYYPISPYCLIIIGANDEKQLDLFFKKFYTPHLLNINTLRTRKGNIVIASSSKKYLEVLKEINSRIKHDGRNYSIETINRLTNKK